MTACKSARRASMQAMHGFSSCTLACCHGLPGLISWLASHGLFSWHACTFVLARMDSSHGSLRVGSLRGMHGHLACGAWTNPLCTLFCALFLFFVTGCLSFCLVRSCLFCLWANFCLCSCLSSPFLLRVGQGGTQPVPCPLTASLM